MNEIKFWIQSHNNEKFDYSSYFNQTMKGKMEDLCINLL